MKMGKEKILCRKWICGKDGVFHCTQTDKSPCGCQSSIQYPRNINDILNEDQKRERNRAIQKIRESIWNGRAALVLGAGISKPSEMPGWNGLISKMMGYAIQYDQLNREGSTVIKTADKVERARLLELTRSLADGRLSLLGNVNTLESAEYVAQLFDTAAAGPGLRRRLEGRAIGSMVRRIVEQSKKPEDLLRAPKTGLQERVRECKSRSPCATIPEIVAEIGEKEVARKNAMFAVSYLLSSENGIRRAMTYNYDPLVQEHMIDLYGVDSGQLITHPGLWGTGSVGPDSREIYHVHGFVAGSRHLKKSNSQVFPEKSGPLILSEDSYYRIEREEAYNWSSSIQSYFLNRYQCIFVGFSADDYNFRRILRQIGEERTAQPHYLILSVRKWISDIYEDVCRARISQAKQAAAKAEMEKIPEDVILLLQYILECRAIYWKRRFNIYPIWATVEEIPQLLTDLLL